MRIHLTMLAKSLALVVAILAVFTLSQGVARADEVTISGSTTGSVTGVPQLTFTGNNSFTGTTDLGTGSLSGVNSLGTFSLGQGDLQSLSGSFTLNITFTTPVGIFGGQATTYTATIVGSVSPTVDEGGVRIHFDPRSQDFTFSAEGHPSGDFTLRVPRDLFVQTGQSADLTAGFTAVQQTSVPEPATLILLGTGLTGVAAKLRKRKKAREENDTSRSS